MKVLRQEIKARQVGYLASEWRRFKRAWTRAGWAGLDDPWIFKRKRLPGAARVP